jgi:hypothetical protein
MKAGPDRGIGKDGSVVECCQPAGGPRHRDGDHPSYLGGGCQFDSSLSGSCCHWQHLGGDLLVRRHQGCRWHRPAAQGGGLAGARGETEVFLTVTTGTTLTVVSPGREVAQPTSALSREEREAPEDWEAERRRRPQEAMTALDPGAPGRSP